MNFTKKTMLASSLLAGATLFSGGAFAQDVEEVVVTGTRISRPDAVSNSPISTVGVQALKESNTINLEQQLRILPQFLPGTTEFANNADGQVEGTASVNLRGLGSQRTLVLMDGKRLPPFDSNGITDLNIVPLALIERVDIVTGGASAVYGSDAIAGVVNFITKTDFEGVVVDGNIQQFEEGDGQTKSVAVTMGGNFAEDRGNAVLSIGYTKRDGVKQGDRAYSFYNLDPSEGDAPITDTSRILGSSNAAATRAAVLVGRNAATGAPAFANRWFSPEGGLGPSSALTSGPNGNNSVYNFNPFNYFQVPQERWQATAQANFEINKYAEVYSRAIFADNKVPVELAPSAYFGGSTGDFQVNLDNPFLTAAQRSVLITAYNNENPTTPYDAAAAPGSQRATVAGIRRRLIELGNRIGLNDTQVFQMMTGIRGDVGETGWTYDVSASFGRTNFQSGTENDVNIERARAGLLAVDGPNGPECFEGPAGCAPVNIFSGSGAIDITTGLPATGAISAEALDFIRANYYSLQVTDQQVVNAVVSGDLGAFKSPFAESPISVAVGSEYRRDFSDFRPDDLTRTGGAMGQGGTAPPLKGATESLEYYGETYIPLVEGAPGAQLIGLELGARYSDTNLAGEFSAYKAGGEYAPVDGLRIRAMFQRAVRAPNVAELFAPAAFGLTEITADPCAGAAPLTDAALRAICIAQGAPASTIGAIDDPAAQQAASISGGAVALGTELAPEEADTFTAGFQLSPNALPGFNASIDYYTVEVAGAIGVFPAQEIVDNCFVDGLQDFCALISRNNLGALEGDGFGISQSTANLSTLNAEGIDYAVSYVFDLGDVGFLKAAALSFNLAGTHTLENSFQSTPDSSLIKCEGLYGPSCGEPIPEDKFSFRSGLEFGAFDIGVTWRYLSSVEAEADAGLEVTEIDAYNYFDLGVRWDLLQNVTLNASVQNLTDEDPPITGNIAGANTSMNTYAATYDPLGRRFGLGLSVKY